MTDPSTNKRRATFLIWAVAAAVVAWVATVLYLATDVTILHSIVPPALACSAPAFVLLGIMVGQYTSESNLDRRYSAQINDIIRAMQKRDEQLRETAPFNLMRAKALLIDIQRQADRLPESQRGNVMLSCNMALDDLSWEYCNPSSIRKHLTNIKAACSTEDSNIISDGIVVWIINLFSTGPSPD